MPYTKSPDAGNPNYRRGVLVARRAEQSGL